MKKYFAILFVLIACITTTVFAQDSLPAHRYVICYQFFSSFITVENNFITNSARSRPPWNNGVQAAAEEQLTVTGEELVIDMFEKNSADAFMHFTGMFIKDTTAADSVLFRFKDIEGRVSVNEQAGSWKNVINYPAFSGAGAFMKNGYRIVKGRFTIGDSIAVELRNKITGQRLLRIGIKKTGEPLIPFLAMYTQDSSAQLNENDFIQRCIRTKDSVQQRLDNFYKDWPARYGGDNNVFGVNTYFPSSKLAFYFARTKATVPDYSLEYKINGGGNTDTGWHQSGHLVMITKLLANSHYRLQVRYAAAPENIWSTTFNVQPYWYQSNGFRGLLTAIIVVSLLLLILAMIYRRKIKDEVPKKKNCSLPYNRCVPS